MKEITILIADDHPIFQRGLEQIIGTDPGLRIVAAVADGESAIAHLRALKPDVAVLDVDMPQRDGFSVLTTARAEGLPTEIVLLTMHREERFVNAALDAGVKGYVLKDSAINDITSAIRAAAEGENFISPMLSTILVRRSMKPVAVAAATTAGSPTVAEKLTSSEMRVLNLVAEFKSNKQIADELYISVRTVENHRSNICAKLGLEGKNALLEYAVRKRAT